MFRQTALWAGLDSLEDKEKARMTVMVIRAFVLLVGLAYLSSLLFSHCWFAIQQDVLQSDWQDVWHSPQPPAFTELAKSLVASVLILFMIMLLSLVVGYGLIEPLN